MKAQASSLPFTPVFTALVTIINTKLPLLGDLVLTRLISQFRRAFKQNNKASHSCITFQSSTYNSARLSVIRPLPLLLTSSTKLLYMKSLHFKFSSCCSSDQLMTPLRLPLGSLVKSGAFLTENSPKANATVFERFRAVLNEGTICHHVQYMIEVLMQVRKDKYKDNPILPEGLDLVEEDEQITHQIQLEDDLQVHEGLNIFKFDPNYLENEEKYKAIRAEILGENSDEESGTESSEEEEGGEEGEEGNWPPTSSSALYSRIHAAIEEKEDIEDRTGTNLVNL
ncbi:armadillo-type protein [Boletus reticuloceps]|uniref:Armadillo-type protein n=1 Tax=Boletus reticuloceps TaxID=495285 RepID=A0A8I2YMZ7_9AGAM|nr:armadillo-type protein [Boletus reticuloceps]